MTQYFWGSFFTYCEGFVNMKEKEDTFFSF